MLFIVSAEDIEIYKQKYMEYQKRKEDGKLPIHKNKTVGEIFREKQGGYL